MKLLFGHVFHIQHCCYFFFVNIRVKLDKLDGNDNHTSPPPSNECWQEEDDEDRPQTKKPKVWILLFFVPFSPLLFSLYLFLLPLPPCMSACLFFFLSFYLRLFISFYYHLILHLVHSILYDQNSIRS